MSTTAPSPVPGTDVFELGAEHEQVVFANDPATGLRAIVAVHSTALGPALGGTRFHPYASTAHALADVLELSRGMSYKAALAGLPARRAAVPFRVGIATAIGWVSRARHRGERTAHRPGQPRRSKLDAHRDFLLGLIETTSDITLVELQARLAAERDVQVSVGTIWTFLDRCGLTFKKSPRMRRSGIGPTS